MMTQFRREDGASKIGKFRIRRDWLTDPKQILIDFLSQVCVLEANYRFDTDSVEYTGYCDEFDYVPQNVAAPSYLVVTEYGKVAEDMQDVVKIMFRRMWLRD
jgi:hypothetical protein